MVKWLPPLEFLAQDWVSWHVKVIDIRVWKLVISIIVVPLHQQFGIRLTQINTKWLEAVFQMLYGQTFGSILRRIEQFETCDSIEIAALNHDLLFHALQILF